MKNRYLSDIDEFLKPDHGTAFDRTYFSRRKTGERRVASDDTVLPGQIIRSGRERRKIDDRRRISKRSSVDTFDMASVKT